MSWFPRFVGPKPKSPHTDREKLRVPCKANTPRPNRQLRIPGGTLSAGGEYVVALAASLADDPSASAEAQYPIVVGVQAYSAPQPMSHTPTTHFSIPFPS